MSAHQGDRTADLAAALQTLRALESGIKRLLALPVGSEHVASLAAQIAQRNDEADPG